MTDRQTHDGYGDGRDGYRDGRDGYHEVPEVEDAPPVPPAPAIPHLADSIGPAVDALPGLARVAAAAWWHTTEWGVRSSARAGLRLARAVTDAEEATALARDATEAAAVIGGLARSVSSGVPLGRALMTVGEHLAEPPEPGASAPGTPGTPATSATSATSATPVVRPERPGRSERSGRSARAGTAGHDGQEGAARGAPESVLRRRGAELLERSRDVWNTDVAHPAYERILDELAPDEARILLLLLQGGPQPSVDVRTGGPIGMVSSQLIAPGLSMIGARAGCRYLDQVPAYLNNLFRLGLVWFSREALRDPMPYQVVEAQPDVLAAMHSVKFAKVVRRSIHLTPFGEDFCRTCLVDEAVAASPLPLHGVPPEVDAGEPPAQG